MSNFYRLFSILKTFKNWHLCLAYHFNLLDKNKERIYYLWSNQKFLAAKEEPWVIKEIFSGKDYIRQNKILDNYIVIDIGANIGCFSIFAATSAKNVKVYSYEPAPETFSRLVRNIKINNLAEFIKPFNLGVAGKSGKREMFISYGGTTDNSICPKYVPDDIKESIEVDVITLQNIFEANSIEICDFLKIDAECSEYEILFNTPPHYLCKIRNIALEYHQGIKELKEFLEKYGFSVICPKSSGSNGMLYARLNRNFTQ